MTAVTKLMTPGGGGVSLTPASSIASDVTVNVPSVNGTLVSTGSTAQVSQAMLASGVAGNGPAFGATGVATQTVATGTYTKLVFNSEIFDTNNNFDSVTNYRFTPTVAGYYQINASAQFYPSGTNAGMVTVYKNGANIGIITANTPLGGSIYMIAAASGILYMNGTTDYVEAYTYQGSGGNLTVYANYFSAALVRAA